MGNHQYAVKVCFYIPSYYNSHIVKYIDGDNVSFRDIQIILEEVKSYGRIIISRVYGDWSKENMKNWLLSASKNGIIPIQCDRISQKNSSDIKLSVDIMKFLYKLNSKYLLTVINTKSLCVVHSDLVSCGTLGEATATTATCKVVYM